MKTFEDICKMTQPEVKAYMNDYLAGHHYKVVNEDGFLYAKGTVPVLLVAHMDTVHKVQCNTIIKKHGELSSPQGIGGDDRCGVFIIMNLIKELNCSVLLCEDEETGTQGARKFVNATYKCTSENNEEVEERYIDNLGVNYMIEFDRKGSNDAVFYTCDNKDFIDFVEDTTNFKYAFGSFTDISVLMPASKLSGVNLSCGYYNAHQVTEYVIYDEMMDTIEVAKTLIKEPCEKAFEYVPKKYEYPKYNYYQNFHSSAYRPAQSYGVNNRSAYGSSYGSYDSGYDSYGNGYYGNLLDNPGEYKDAQLANIAKTDTDLELEITTLDLDMSEKTIIATGENKAECWMNMFLENPNLCFNDILDYTWG